MIKPIHYRIHLEPDLEKFLFAGRTEILVERTSETISREEMLREVWGYGPGVETRTVDNFMRRLRTYFEKDPASPEHIVSVRGLGYRFDP